jgi:hypothetical protein
MGHLTYKVFNLHYYLSNVGLLTSHLTQHYYFKYPKSSMLPFRILILKSLLSNENHNDKPTPLEVVERGGLFCNSFGSYVTGLCGTREIRDFSEAQSSPFLRCSTR